MKKIGIMGGTFDPIHNGHIFLAKTAMEKCKLDTVIFLPLCIPPHKKNPIASAQIRLELIKKAIGNISNFEVSDMEINRKGTTYTIDTLLRITNLYCDADIYYIIGTDTLLELDKWKNIEQVFELCTFICVSRPIENLNIQKQKQIELEKKYNKEIITLPIMGKNISSTMIRSGNNIENLVPDSILKDVKNIYVKDEKTIDRKNIIEKLKTLISKDRLNHTLNVEKQAIMLAKIYGANVDKSSIAALLHDCAKNIYKNPTEFAKKHKIEQFLSNYEDLPKNILHAPMGAHLAAVEFEIKDPQILSAIMWHTSGKPDMSLLDKIIYLADYTEPSRFSGPKLEEVRSLVKTDLDMALYKALKYSIENIESKGHIVHSSTLNAYSYMKNKMEEQNG